MPPTCGVSGHGAPVCLGPGRGPLQGVEREAGLGHAHSSRTLVGDVFTLHLVAATGFTGQVSCLLGGPIPALPCAWGLTLASRSSWESALIRERTFQNLSGGTRTQGVWPPFSRKGSVASVLSGRTTLSLEEC